VRLFEPADHEPLEGTWDPERTRAAVREIAADTEEAFDGGWRAHPRDLEPGEKEIWSGTYFGGAGIVDALRRLADRGLIELRRDYLSYVEQLEPDEPGTGLMVGETGIVLVRHRLMPTDGTREELRRLVAESVDSDARELLLGSPGTMLVAHELGFDDLYLAAAERLLEARDPETGLWEQHIWGKRRVYIGAAHGFAGCVLALGDFDGASETARRYALAEDGLANWPPVLDHTADGTIRMQWCHGAPGMITSLGDVLDEDLALAGGELTWRAGPLVKGPNLCHGTAGNGYAFLTLFERTGDELWLERARAFAAHTIGQVERLRAERGTGWHSLWTGDLGAALYLADCVDGGGTLPLP
jgi:hypothetical protein